LHVTLLQLLTRYWRVTVPILLASIVAAVAVQQLMPPNYRAAGSVMLATPAQDPRPMAAPLVQLSETVDELQGLEVRDLLVSGDAAFSAQLLDQTTLIVTAASRNASTAEETVTAAVEWFGASLEERQRSADIAPEDRLSSQLLTPVIQAHRAAVGAYEAEAILWIEGLRSSGDNPYQASPVTARLLAVWLSGDEGREALSEWIGPGADFAVAHDPWGPLPTLDIVTHGRDSDSAVAAFDEIVELLELELNSRQARAQVPIPRRLFIDVLARPEDPVDTRPPLEPLAVLVFLAGLAAAGGTAGYLHTKRSPRDAPTVAVDEPARDVVVGV
jgi:hypothetical protein